jgi:hypothetical protein
MPVRVRFQPRFSVIVRATKLSVKRTGRRLAGMPDLQRLHARQRDISATRGRVESVSKERALGHSNLVIALTHSLPTRKREQMNPDEIKIDHCYLMRPIHGRRIVVRVTKLLDMTVRMAASEDVQPGGTESLTMKPIMVRFVWRRAAYPTGWSANQQQLPLDTFALAVEEDVTCS